ncbi:tryptophan-rich sensory protein [Mucilaginibacter achroorhodeus]|uniref:Tryptophan-rich sensory protein n=1 Tax=Mucilaginibacter achroorhodeus TaxID=2599294 RepID=A0A563U8S3_9SPHI|nr:TspO/MBR family protein [Mucilaginibacter achroorhodeus]TWR27782.1 tryptophan-rich sensory protein [Mucilaginibacter achroorhodeus]
MVEEKPSGKFQFIPLLISLIITLAIGFTASFFTRPEIEGWYQTLKKPTFTPPNFVFPIAWTLLYILIAIAAYLVWKKRDRSVTYKTAAVIYALQLLFNFSWSIVFFEFHQILGGLLVIIALLVIIILNISWFNRFSKPAAYLLIPYFLWVSFATLLNLSIYIFNK